MILVTGATGFIGTHLVRELVGKGEHVRVALRRSAAHPSVPQGVEVVVTGDLRGPVHWDSALDGVRTVVHLAGRAHVLRGTDLEGERQYWLVNTDATRALAEAAAAARVARLIFISSSRAIGDETPPGQRWHEGTPCAPRDAYGSSKLEAERAVMAVSRRHGLQAVILRLPVVYGPGVAGNIYELFKLTDRGIPLPLGLVHNRRSLLYVGNLVDVIRRVIGSRIVGAWMFHVADAETPSTLELVRRIADALRRPTRLMPVPPALLRAGGYLGDLVERATGMSLPLNSDNVIRLVGSLILDTTRIQQTLGWVPPHALEVGLAQTATWFREARRPEAGAARAE